MRAAAKLCVLATLVTLVFLAIGCKSGEQAQAPETTAAQPAAPAPAAPAPAPAPPELAVGMTVAAPWGGSLYLGTIQAVSGDTFDVLYADDQQVRQVQRNELKVVAPQSWKVGDKVKAVWTTGKFYDGAVTADKGNGVYTVAWSDGSAPSDVEATKIMAP